MLTRDTTRRVLFAVASLWLPILLTANIISLDDTTEAFFAAVRKGDAKAVEDFLNKGVSVEAKWRYDQTALFPASDRGHVEVVKVLLAHGANVNAEDSFYHATPMTWATSNDHPEVVQLLLEKGAKGKGDALGYAVDKKHPELVEWILKQGGIEPKTLTSVLRQAKKAKNDPLVEMLTKAGATDPEFKVDADTLQSYAGQYKPAVPGNVPDLGFKMTDGRLTGGVPGQPPLTLYATDKSAFDVAETERIKFNFKVEEGKVTGLVLMQGGTPINYKRVEDK